MKPFLKAGAIVFYACSLCIFAGWLMESGACLLIGAILDGASE